MWILKALFLFFAGLGLVVYRERVQAFSGNLSLAEQYLGAGGTFTFYLFFGIGMMIFSILYATGVTDGVIQSLFGKFFFMPPQ